MVSDRNDNNDNINIKMTLLENIEAVPQITVDMLRKVWITTVEELLATAATDSGHAGLCRILVCDEVELQKLLDVVSNVVSPEYMALLQKPGKACKFGLLLSEEHITHQSSSSKEKGEVE